MSELNTKHISTIKTASKYLAGHKRRVFQAQVSLDYLGGSSRQAEGVFGWCRQTVSLGLQELRSGIECIGYFTARGNRKTESKQPQLEIDIRDLA